MRIYQARYEIERLNVIDRNQRLREITQIHSAACKSFIVRL
jgi:hypothetical protein